jgi:transcriptional regulator GlxA family with amidase domain
MLVCLVAFDEFTDIDLWLTWDLLNRVRIAGWQVEIVSQRPRARSRTGMWIDVHGGLARAEEAQAVVFCGGPGAAACAEDPRFLGALRLEPRSQLLTAVNEGALILGALGLLRGRRVTAPPAAAVLRALQNHGAQIEPTSLVEHGPVVTAAQSMAAAHLAEWIVTRLAGRATAQAMIKSVAPLDALAQLRPKT